MGGRRLTVEERAGVCAWYRRGKSLKAICQHFGVTSSTVCRLAREAGLPPRGWRSARARRLAATNLYTDMAKAINDFLRGVPLKHLAERYGVSSRTVRRALESRGVLGAGGVVLCEQPVGYLPPGRRNRAGLARLQAELPEVCARYRAGGVTLAMLAIQYDVSPGAVRKSLLSAGVTMHRSGRRVWRVGEVEDDD